MFTQRGSQSGATIFRPLVSSCLIVGLLCPVASLAAQQATLAPSLPETTCWLELTLPKGR